MYYDRTVPEALLATVLPDGPLGWLVAWVHSPEGSKTLADVQLRKNSKSACLQVYLGGTAVLSIGLRGSKIELCADSSYKSAGPSLFGKLHEQNALLAAQTEISGYLVAVRACIAERHMTAEAQLHGGFMRRYGLTVGLPDPCVALDREVRIGYASIAERESIREKFDARLPAQFPETNYIELDAVVTLPGGDIGMVEIKDRDSGESLTVAAKQAAAHVLRFRILDEEEPGWRQSLSRLAEQKGRAKLLPRVPELSDRGSLVPIIAATGDDRSNWADRWRAAIRPTMTEYGDPLAGLQMWRLSSLGVIEDRATA